MQKQNIQINYKGDQSVMNLASVNNPSQLDRSLTSGPRRSRSSCPPKDLERLITRLKVQRLVNGFIKKLRLNSVHRKPRDFNQENEPEKNKDRTMVEQAKDYLKSVGEKEGFDMGNCGLIIWSLTNIFQISLMVFIFSIMMAFPETQDYSLFLYFRMMSIALYVIDMFLNFSVARYESGKELKKIKEISYEYLRNGFVIDLISILIFPIDVLVNMKTNITIFISFVAIIKLVNNIKKFQKFEYLIINSEGKEHYFGLVKVFMMNFAIGHLLSICLNLMANINAPQNWQDKLGINNAEWYVKYIWGYYWGTNIMLTVGFGDICASNYYEAIVLVFIETFSCITLAYNINYVGALIGSIRESEEKKKKKLKIFHRMCQENFVSKMESKIVNFIQEQYRIKQSFEYDAHDEALKSLPKNLEIQFRKEANKTLFDNIGFFKYLSKKSLFKLAEIISRKICHPEEIVFGKGSVSDFMILQKGALSFVCRIRSLLDGTEIESIDIKEGEKPKMISFNFLKNKLINYNIKSKSYSVVYYLTREEILESLRSSDMDFQMMCQLKDKDEQEIYENNLYLCSVCKTEYHNKFECNRLHYVPLKRTIILKYLFKIDKIKQKREKAFKRSKITLSPAKIWKDLKQEQKRYIEFNFDDEHYREIENLYNFYSKLEGGNLGNSVVGETKTYKSQFANSTKTNFKPVLDDKTLVRLEEMLENKANKSVFDFWDFQIDEAENFNFYFREGNPDQLKKAKKYRKNKGIFQFFHLNLDR